LMGHAVATVLTGKLSKNLIRSLAGCSTILKRKIQNHVVNF